MTKLNGALDPIQFPVSRNTAPCTRHCINIDSIADVTGVSLTGFCANIRNRQLNKNPNDLTNKDVYTGNFDSQFLIIQIPFPILADRT